MNTLRLKNSKIADKLATIASIGHPKHLDKLVNHPDERVKAAVAFAGNVKHLNRLKTDKNKFVKHIAKKRLIDPNYNTDAYRKEFDLPEE